MANTETSSAAGSEERPLKTEEMTLDQMLIQYAARIRKASKGNNPIRDAALAREAVRNAIAAQNNATYEAVMEAIGEDETHWTDHLGHESNVPTDSMRDRNQLRAELRQSIAKIFGREPH